MSTAAVSSNLISEIPKAYFQTRYADLQQLGHALKSGDLAGAQTAYNNIVTLGQSGPFAGGNPFRINQREQDFTAIGQPLQSGDLAGAQQAFAKLASTFNGGKRVDPPSASPASSSGPEIVVNLSNSSGNTSPEQITINIANSASGGGEQVSLSVGNQGSNAQQITFNLSPNSNEEIVLNLLGGSSSTGSSSSSSATSSSSSGASSSTGLSVSA
jgi:hypothetical protein